MGKYKRIFVVVLDSLGIGAVEDSPEYGDVGVDTLDVYKRQSIYKTVFHGPQTRIPMVRRKMHQRQR